MSNKGKTKGRTYEYKIRDIFSETFNNKFERVPLSGALSYLKGDIFCPYLPDFRWCVECKHHKEVNWNNLLTATKSNLLLDFWEQTTREADVMKASPLLIYRWDNGKDHVCWIDEDINLPNQIHVQIDKYKFKMGLLTDWLVEAKKVI